MGEAHKVPFLDMESVYNNKKNGKRSKKKGKKFRSKKAKWNSSTRKSSNFGPTSYSKSPVRRNQMKLKSAVPKSSNKKSSRPNSSDIS